MSDVLTVSSFARFARECIEDAFGDVKVEGEISNFKQHTSGHCYFTLKDREAQVKCVMWRHTAQSLYFRPEDGMQVRLYGKASVYEKRGDLQLVARALRHAGEGGLQKAFEELKRKLQQEGLFDTEIKKPFPTFPKRIGVITSETGAALHDILSIIERRYPIVEVLLFPVQVQGPQAAPTICAAIEHINALVTQEEYRVEVLIVGRGGGSLEDLWAFNEEEVARAIYASSIPIMSAVGHETDFTISDYVADKRAATPSMAAELLTPSAPELYAYIQSLSHRSRELVLSRIEEHNRYIQAILSKHSFNRPVDQLAQYRQHVDLLASRLSRLGPKYLDGLKERVESLNQRLSLLDPYRPLKKGYAIVEQDGQFIRSADALHSEKPATVRFEDGVRTIRTTD
ncbi:MAG: exodeoxyribonuclease VII large subunit [Rhodothermaceae bacterium]|nr:exodeoxyribonuclease VII large subunit [Rhodothermaceae bacterium]